MQRLKIATCLWTPNGKSFEFSKVYDETWVEKLYRGFSRNLDEPFDFFVFVDDPSKYEFLIPEVHVVQLNDKEPGYDAYIEPFQLPGPLLVVGLDTVIVGDCNFLADLARNQEHLYLPLDPNAGVACNAIAVVPEGHEEIFDLHNGENDMEWLRKFPHKFLDDAFPDKVVSYKKRVRMRTYQDHWSIIYFHGNPKMDQLHGKLEWVTKHWT